MKLYTRQRLPLSVAALVMAVLALLLPLLLPQTALAKRLAVLEFKGEDLEPKARAYLSRKVRGEALKHLPAGWTVMTRDNMLVLIDAAQGQCVREGECEVETFRNIGADQGVAGEVVKLGGMLRLTLHAYDAKSGGLLATAEAAAWDLDGVLARLPDACATLLGRPGEGNAVVLEAPRPKRSQLPEADPGGGVTWRTPVGIAGAAAVLTGLALGAAAMGYAGDLQTTPRPADEARRLAETGTSLARWADGLMLVGVGLVVGAVAF